jgi:hypothetical protein
MNDGIDGKTGCIALLITIAIISGLFIKNWWTKNQAKLLVFSEAKGFWRGTVSKSKYDYWLTDKYIPLRAIARRPNVPLYEDVTLGPEDSFRRVMRPWKPYYVYGYDAGKGALRVAESAQAHKEDTLWVLEADVYCWTTRETLSLEQPMPIYASLADAKEGRNPIVSDYTFPYSRHFGVAGDSRNRLPSMAALPVLRREEGQYWSFIRPDPDPQPGRDRPYQVCWIRWNGSNANANVRLRVTRPEFEDYVAGVQKLLFDYRYGSADDQATARLDLVKHGQAHTTGEESRQQAKSYSSSELQSRNEGVPKLGGYLELPIQSPLQYDNVKGRASELMKLSNTRTVWDAEEIAYIEVDRLP